MSSLSTDLHHVDSPAAEDLRRRESLAQVAPERGSLVEQVRGREDELVSALAEAGVSAPLYGAEVSDGTPVEFAWVGSRVVVVLDIDEETVRNLSDDGWRVVGPDTAAIVEALGAPEGVR